MESLFQSPTFLSLSCHKHPLSSKPQQWLRLKIHECPSPRNLKIYAFSSKRPRSGRNVKSNEELCNDIREFVAAVGLPEGHFPSLKELSQHGRNDLANIVRRRGYKLIKMLLTSSAKTEIDGFSAEKSVNQDTPAYSGDNFAGQSQKGENAIKDASLPTEVFSMENSLVGIDSYGPKESPAMSTLEEKVAKFVQNGDLDSIDYNVYGILNESDNKENREVVESNNEVTIQSSSNSQECSEHSYGSATTLNESTKVAKQVAPPVAMNYLPWSHDNRKAQLLKDDDLTEDKNSETSGRDNEMEINHLNFMLHQKELELSRLKEQIEKEKIALSDLQTKAETEIHKAQKLVSEKDAELHAAEESLSGLVEVQIDYSGEGEIVEVAGSFNGWHHRVKMDPQPSSTVKNHNESRKPKLWSTVLWLYPGIYEIKFVVDGKWKIDPRRESTDRGGITNNILRVHR